MKRQYTRPELCKVGTLSKLTKTTTKDFGTPADGFFLGSSAMTNVS